MMPVLDDTQMSDLLRDLPDWRRDDDGQAIRVDWLFGDFRAAFSFMTQVAAAAERADHHPEWSNVYNRVHIRLTTHDAGAVTHKDASLARIIDGLARDHGGVAVNQAP